MTSVAGNNPILSCPFSPLPRPPRWPLRVLQDALGPVNDRSAPGTNVIEVNAIDSTASFVFPAGHSLVSSSNDLCFPGPGGASKRLSDLRLGHSIPQIAPAGLDVRARAAKQAHQNSDEAATDDTCDDFFHKSITRPANSRGGATPTSRFGEDGQRQAAGTSFWPFYSSCRGWGHDFHPPAFHSILQPPFSVVMA
jgi:hypothetical protein